jgi:general L-amino acid transport system permease protein
VSLAGMFFVSKGGLAFPWPTWPGTAFALIAAGLVAGIVAAVAWRRRAFRVFERTGQVRSLVAVPLVLVVAGAIAGWLVAGAPHQWSIPAPGTFTMEGGAAATPEFIGVLIGLVLYTAAFIAEVVRAGIQAVPHGQTEAAASLGLPRGLTMRLVTLPQALRVIIPPMTSQYLNLTKNSSLAVAIGYPDVVSIANTSLNQTGRAVECIAIIMAVYLTTSLTTSVFMNWYNRRSAIRER